MLSMDSAIGIEVDGRHLRLVTLSKQLGGYAVKRTAVIQNFRELERSALQEQIGTYTRGNGFNRENVVLALPRSQVILRTLDLPLDVEENLAQVVGFQVDRFEPTEQEQSYYDHLVLNRDEKTKKIELQLLMARRSLVDEYLNLFRDLNLYPALIQFSGLGVQQLLALRPEGFPKKEPVLILHSTEQEEFEAVLVVRRDCFYSARVHFPGEWTLDLLLEEVGTFLSRLSLPEEGIAKIYLSGPVAAQLLEPLQQRFEQCELLSSRTRLATQTGDTGFQEVVGAAGAALSALQRSPSGKLNLIPAEKRLFSRRVSLVPTYALAVLLVLLVGTFLGRENFQQQEVLQRLETQIQGFQPQVDSALSLRQQIEDKRGQLAEIRDLLGDRQKVLAIMKEMTEKLPDHSYLQSMQIQEGRVSMFGYSDSASSLVPLLQNAKYVKSVESRGISRDTRIGKDRFQFEMVTQ